MKFNLPAVGTSVPPYIGRSHYVMDSTIALSYLRCLGLLRPAASFRNFIGTLKFTGNMFTIFKVLIVRRVLVNAGYHTYISPRKQQINYQHYNFIEFLIHHC